MFAIPQPPPAIVFYENNFHKNNIMSKKDAFFIQQSSENIKKTIKYTNEFSKLLIDTEIDSNLKQKIIANLVSFLVLTQSDKITFEKTPEDSFLTKANFDDKNYFLAIYFDDEISHGYECFLNVYKDKKYVSNFHGELDKVFLELINC
jgi:hypothetical protein